MIKTRKYTKHGLTKSPIYKLWKTIKQRLYNSKDNRFPYYGGRGICMCEEWRNDFMSFYNWSIQNGYSNDLSIDRINNDGNYEPLNCRFTTNLIQNRNTRLLQINNTSGYRGVSFSNDRKKWISSISINNKKIKIGQFNTAIEAAQEYDNYVINNHLEHTLNFITTS